VHERESARLPQRHQRREVRVEAEVAVEVEHAAVLARTRQRDRRARLVVRAFAVGHDDAQAVDGAAQEHDDQALVAGQRLAGGRRGGGEGGAADGAPAEAGGRGQLQELSALHEVSPGAFSDA
jgi:hypothetical protein